MFALSQRLVMRQTLHLPGILDPLIDELESTPSSSHRARLLRRLALSHMWQAVDPIVPFLSSSQPPRVRHAAVEALVSLSEHSRETMLDVLRDSHRRELHAGAVQVLAGIVKVEAAPSRRGPLGATG
jgi:HEAT repeat protein